MVSACIFDLNGTVVDDEHVFGHAFKHLLEKMGATEVPDMPQIGGIGVEENWPVLLNQYNVSSNKSPQELAILTHKEYLAHINEVSVTAGFEVLGDALKEQGVLLSIATSSTWTLTDAILTHVGLEDYFDVITVGDEVTAKKPSPEIFILTAEKLYVPTTECIVFEDSSSGIAAAKSAGMLSVGVYRDEDHKRKLKGAAHLIHDFTEITPNNLNAA